MSTLGPRTALKSRKISGSLAYILAQTNVKQGTKALPNDVAGCTLEMSASGWVGCLGVFASDAAMATATGGNYTNLNNNGSYCQIAGVIKNHLGPILNWASPAYMTCYQNFKPENLKHWRKAISVSRSEGASAQLAIVGDSTIRGAGSNGSPSVNVITKSFPTRLAGLLSNKFSTQIQSVFGDGTFGVPLPTLDPRVSLSGSFKASGVSTIGGMALQALSAGAITFTPTTPCQYFDVWYIHSSGNGIFSLDVGGAGSTNYNTGTSGDISLEKVTIDAGSSSLSPLHINHVSGNILFIVGFSGRSNSDQLQIYNLGRSGSKVGNWSASTNSPWDPLPALISLAPNLTIICLTINDAAQSTSIDAYISNMQLVINAAKSTGDVILLIGVPTNTTISAQINQDAIRAACYQLSNSNDVPIIDLVSRFISWTDAFGFGFMYDNYHPNAVGYCDVASIVADALFSIGY